MSLLLLMKRFLFSSFLGLAVILGTPVLAGEEEAKQAKELPSPSPSSSVEPSPQPVVLRKSSSGCVVDEFAVEDVRKGRAAVEAKLKELALKEADLKAREVAIAEELKKLEDTRDSITKARDQKKKENEEKVAKLVETFLTMSPKSASKVLSTLDDNLAIAILTQMETVRLAKIMNLLEPSRSSHLSELMVGLTKARVPATPIHRDVAPIFKPTENKLASGAVATLSQKGGKKDDEHKELSAAADRQESSAQSHGNTSEKEQKDGK